MPARFLAAHAAMLLALTVLPCLHGVHGKAFDVRPSVANLTLTWFTQTVDHFGFGVPASGNTTFPQRVFTYDKFWGKGGCPTVPGPIFFYTGAMC
jgi:hypothetical protein